MEKPSGFTIVFDGLPDEVMRILDAVAREYQSVQEECALAADGLVFGQPYTLYHPRSSLRGRLELRYDATAHDAHRALLDISRPG